MDLLIRNIKVFYPGHKLHEKKVSILVKDGRVHRIGPGIRSKYAEVWEKPNCFLSPGWLDLNTFVGEPGYEHRETMETLAESAHRGGYTSIAPAPNTFPVVDQKTAIHFLLKEAQRSGLNIIPLGAITQGCQGKDITELCDMHHSGAAAFTDGFISVQNNGVMMRALQYVKSFNGLVINHPFDTTIAEEGLIHEGEISTSMGMRGIPPLAETLMVQRDIGLLKYTDSRLHILNISSAESISLLEQAKKDKLNLSASVPILNLVATDEECSSFNYRYKVLPPLREKKDIELLYKAVKKGTILGINSNHVPVDEESKDLEFAHAAFGAIGLETAFALLNTHYPDELELWIDCLVRRNRDVLGIEPPKLEKGARAEFTIFDPKEKWTLTEDDIGSKSKNTPFLNTEFVGRVKGIVNGHTVKTW